jgi:hypothetical protein
MWIKPVQDLNLNRRSISGLEPERPVTRYSSIFFNFGATWKWMFNATGRTFYAREKSRYPFYRRLAKPRGPSWRVRKMLLSAGFDPRTFQLLASRYTYYVLRPLYLRAIRKQSARDFSSTTLNLLWNPPCLLSGVPGAIPPGLELPELEHDL